MTEPWALTPLEEYFLLEDRPAYPWTFFVRLGFAGCVDRRSAETALCHSIARHPLLSSIVWRRPGGWAWQRVEQPHPAVQWNTGDADDHYVKATRLDLTEEIGIRLYATVGSDSSQIIFQFHHACCDARGAFLLIDDWLTEYVRLAVGGEDHEPPQARDPLPLERRGQITRNAQQTSGVWFARWAGFMRAYRFLRQHPIPLLDYQPAGDEEPTPAGFPAARSFRFDAATTAQLRLAAKRQESTVNDLLCRDLLLALHGFRRQLVPKQTDGWLRVAVPTDMRTRTQDRLSAANQVSMVFVTRRERDCLAAESLLRGIHRELQLVKLWGLGRTFLRSLQMRRQLPGGLARSVRNGRCGATTALTNLGETLVESRLPRCGDKLVVGDLLLDTADFLAPIRPWTCASFAACTYAGRLSICLQYDRRALEEPAADRLFELFLRQLQSNLD
jgi:NRPS condensation-like uncharacterized protein